MRCCTDPDFAALGESWDRLARAVNKADGTRYMLAGRL